MDSAIVKLNDGVSGEGNAVVRLSGLPPPGSSTERAAVMDRVRVMELESTTTPLDAYLAKFQEGAGIVEERIVGEEIRSPSVQLRVLPDGGVELPLDARPAARRRERQSYLGCTFPAAPEYARAITQQAALIGQHLAGLGALGRFAVDFVVVRETSGAVDAVRHRAQPPQGRDDAPVPDAAVPHRRPLRSDHGPVPHAARPREAPGRDRPPRGRAAPWAGTVRPVRHRRPARDSSFDQSRQVGVVFHMISCLTEHGRIGLTAVGDTPSEAGRRYRDAERILLEEARLALEEVPLPG